MSNVSAIRAVLDSPEFDVVRDEIRTNKLSYAKGSLFTYQEKIAAFVPTGNAYRDGEIKPFLRIYTTWTNQHEVVADEGYGHVIVAGQKINRHDRVAMAKAIAPLLVINEAEVIKAADREWDETKAFYAARVGDKADLIGGDGTIDLNIRRNQFLIGNCTVTLGDKVLVLETSLKTNYRYGENAANGDLTIYRQVPTIIVSAKGFDPVSVEAARDAAIMAAKSDRKARIATLRDAVDAAQYRKEWWAEIVNHLECCVRYGGAYLRGPGEYARNAWTKLGNDGKPWPSLSEARLNRKSALAAHKAAKEAYKAAKAEV